MTPSPRFLRYVAVACFAAFPTFYSSQNAIAQDQAAPAAQTEAPVAEDLLRDVRNFWHYGKIARYDLANAEGQKILQRTDPVEVLRAFEQVASERPDQRADIIDEWILRWQGVEQMRDTATQLSKMLNQAYSQRNQDPNFIESNIERLIRGRRAYVQGLARLRESGELAVPMMVDYLRDPAKREYHAAVRSALKDMGRVALNPLLAALEMKQEEPLIAIIGVLADIGYEGPIPYLARLARTSETQSVQVAAKQALQRMGVGNAEDPATLFYNLAEKLYYENAVAATDAVANTNNVWSWDDSKGLQRNMVPAAVFNEILSMRAAEQSLQINPNKDETVSLWLAANYKREAELSDSAATSGGTTDQPPAHFFGAASGARYLNSALSRALRDRNAAVALKVIKSLQDIGGQSNLFNSGQGQPLIDALRYPDRLVRYEAAFALAEALPQQSFQGQEYVVPLLAEAISQTGAPNVLVLAPVGGLTPLVEGLRGQGYGSVGASSAEAAINQANSLPAVDVVVVSDDLEGAEIDRFFELMTQTPRLARSSRVIINRTDRLKLEGQAATDPLLNLTKETDPAALKPVIEQARSRSGSMPLDAQVATQYALRASELLAHVAMSRGQVFDVTVSEQSLLQSLAKDERADVVKAVGEILATINSRNSQFALLAEASEAQTADDVKISLYNSLATNAKFYGNQLSTEEVQPLRKDVQEAGNQDVRNAAAAAHGALNLPADQAKQLILAQKTK